MKHLEQLSLVLSSILTDDRLHIVIVGGGPIGLACASRLAFQFNKLVRITLFEKRATAERKQILLIQHKWMEEDKLFKRPFLDDLKNAGCYVVPPRSATDVQCYEDSTMELPPGLEGKYQKPTNLDFSIQTAFLQDMFLRQIKEINRKRQVISVVHEEITIKKILEEYNPDILIGAAGGNDIVFNYLKLTNDREFYRLSQNTSRAIIFTWQPPLFETKKRAPWVLLDQQPKQDRFRFFRAKDIDEKKLNFYGSIQLTDLEYNVLSAKVNQMNDHLKQKQKLRDFSTWKQWSTLTFEDSAEISMKNTLLDFVNYYQLDETLRPPPETKISFFDINVYRESKFATINHNVPMFLMGDSAVGVHFFSGTGVNSGFFMMDRFLTLFAKWINNPIKNRSTLLDHVLIQPYNAFVDSYLNLSIQNSLHVVPNQKVSSPSSKEVLIRSLVNEKYFPLKNIERLSLSTLIHFWRTQL